MRRRLAISLFVVIASLAALLLLYLLLDWRELRGEALDAIEQALGLPVEVEGPIRPLLTSTPGLVFHDVRIGSGKAPDAPPLLEARRLSIGLDLGALLLHLEIRIDALGLREGSIVIADDANASAQPSSAKDLASFLRALPGDVRLRDVSIELHTDTGRRLLEVDRMRFESGASLELSGTLNGLPIQLESHFDAQTGNALNVNTLDLQIAESRISGQLQIRAAEPLAVTGTLHSERLVAREWIQAIYAAGESDAGRRSWLDFDLPYDAIAALETHLVGHVDRLEIGRYVASDVAISQSIHEGRLELQIEKATLAGGKVSSLLRSDAAARTVDASAVLEALDIGELEGNPETRGRLDVDFDLVGSGATPRELLATSSGRLSMSLGETRVSRSLTALGQDLFGILFSSVDHKKNGVLRCGVLRSEIHEGAGDMIVVVETKSSTLSGLGRLDLVHLRAGVVLEPHPHRFSVGALKTPIYIGGPIGHLRASVDVKKLALDTATAAAFGFINPFALVIPLIDLGTGGANACARALDAARIEAPHATSLSGRSLELLRRGGEQLGDFGSRVLHRDHHLEH